MSVVSNQGQGLKPLTHARILAIALPIMLSNASVPLVDSIPSSWGAWAAKA